MISLLTAAFVVISCNSNKATHPQEVPQVDYAGVVNQAFPSVDRFVELVNDFQIATEQRVPTSENWN